jgi:hypothetical protein
MQMVKILFNLILENNVYCYCLYVHMKNSTMSKEIFMKCKVDGPS